jgi:hypothetical protein
MPLLGRNVYSPPTPAATWLTWPTLRESLGTFPADGSSFCRESRRLLHEYGSLVTAELRTETKGENAGEVNVFVAGSQVARIPYDAAYTFRGVIDAVHRRGLPATCRAELDADEQGHVLLHTQPEVRSANEPFLPPIDEVVVDVGFRQSQRLDQSLPATAGRSHVSHTALLALDAGYWALLLDGQRLGFLQSHRYPRLTEALERGFPLTCSVAYGRVANRTVSVRAAFPAW